MNANEKADFLKKNLQEMDADFNDRFDKIDASLEKIGLRLEKLEASFRLMEIQLKEKHHEEETQD